jgi:hypothetical protein
VTPPRAPGEAMTPVARLTMYEVAEALRFKTAARDRGEPAHLRLVPFQVPGSAGYWYREHAATMDGVTIEPDLAKRRALDSHEFALGIPLTKAVLVLFG